MRNNYKADVLVVGSGLAGLNYALTLAKLRSDLKVMVITKQKLDESNTRHAQGGVAIVQGIEDSFEKHIEDTIQAGDGLCDPSIVDLVIRKSAECYGGLSDLGIAFDKTDNGSCDLGLEGGHSAKRIIHVKDQTGLAIQTALINTIRQLPNITVLEDVFALDLMIQTSTNQLMECVGAKVLDVKSKLIQKIYSKVTMIATGGIGQVYRYTTNPVIASGDGIAMASRANAKIRDMEFVQFHPTALYKKRVESSFLISEAVRGFGALLRNRYGEEFMVHYDKRKELASRDVVSRAIIKEMSKLKDNFLFLDCRHLDIEEFKKKFPTIYNHCLDSGFNPEIDFIPIIPTEHYLCGGIEVDAFGQTSIQNLLASGECARTGLHGANRLASNSLLEAFVLSKMSAEQTAATIDLVRLSDFSKDKDPIIVSDQHDSKSLQNLKRKLQEAMWRFAGIIRSDAGLKEGLNSLKSIEKELNEGFDQKEVSVTLMEFRNLLEVAKLIIKQSVERNENRGGFFNEDLVRNDNKIPFHGDFSI